MIKMLFPLSFDIKDVATMVMRILLYLILGVIVGVIGYVIAIIPFIGFIISWVISSICSIYILGGITFTVLNFLKIV